MKLPQLRWPRIDMEIKTAHRPQPLGERLLWMAGIWAASVLALLALAMLLRFALLG